MNGAKKFHKANGPAFAPGEIWESISGHVKVRIESVRFYGPDKWDSCVTYRNLADDALNRDRDTWNFQVRYRHLADKFI